MDPMSEKRTADEPLSYLFRRVAVYLGTRANLFTTLIALRARADGWLAIETLGALTQPQTTARRFDAVVPRGISQGHSPDEADLEVTFGDERLALRIRSLPVDPSRPPNLSPVAHQPPESVLILVSYPVRLDDQIWQDATETMARTPGITLLDQVQFQLPGPDRVVVSLWRRG
jgi:hypothetical protein